MTDYTVTNSETLPDGTLRIWRRRETDATLHTVTIHPDVFTYRAAEYGVTDLAELLEMCVREPFHPDTWDDPRDDPAVRQGWVTTTTPDAEPITLYNARSTADAGAAHRVRGNDGRDRLLDPDGILTLAAAGIALDGDKYQEHQQQVDTSRWRMVYGGLPVEPPHRKDT